MRVVPLLNRERFPEIVPAATGVNTTGTLTLCAGLRVSGVVMPVVKPLPVMESWVILAAAEPLLVIFTANVAGVFSTSCPKLRLVGVAVRLGVPGAAGVGVGVGDGPGGDPPLDLCVPAPPPQPMAHTRERTKRRKTHEYLLAILVLCKEELLTPETFRLIAGAKCFFGYFINFDKAWQT